MGAHTPKHRPRDLQSAPMAIAMTGPWWTRGLMPSAGPRGPRDPSSRRTPRGAS